MKKNGGRRKKVMAAAQDGSNADKEACLAFYRTNFAPGRLLGGGDDTQMVVVDDIIGGGICRA